jgi:hypothetical protein
MVSSEKLKNAVATILEFEQQMKDTYEFLNNNNGSKFLSVSDPTDFRVEVADGHASLFSHQVGWEYQTYEDTILSGDSDNGIFVGKNAEVFFMDEEDKIKWLNQKNKEYEEELNRRRLEELQRQQREVKRELEIEKIKQSDEYKNYLKLKDKFSSIDRRN